MFLQDPDPVTFSDNPIYEEYPRISTPLPERDISLMINADGSHRAEPDVQYEKFRITLETKTLDFKVRGLQRVPGDIISGSFSMYDEADSRKTNRQPYWMSWIFNKIETTFTNRYKPR